MDLQAMRNRIQQLEAQLEQKTLETNRLELCNMELQYKHDKLYDNLERFVGNNTVGNYYEWDTEL